MATKAGVGMSRHRDPRMAGRIAAEKALKNAGIETPDFVFMFASTGHDQRSLLKAVREATGNAPLSGCSAEGTIAGDEADESNFSVAVMTIASDELRFRHGFAIGLKEDSGGAGRSIAEAIQAEIRADTLGLFVFPDGLTVNDDRFLAEIEGNLRLDQPLPIWGGAAGDNLSWKQTYQYCDDMVVSDGAAYVLLSGQAQYACALSHGCIPIGLERKVTRCEGNVVYEIDGKPVLEVIKEYLADRALADNWPEYVITLALCFKAPGYIEDEEFIVRGMPSVDETTGSVTIQTEVSEGASVWMSSRDQEKIFAGLNQIAGRVKAQLGTNKPKFVFQFDCVGRGKLMFRDQEKMRNLETLQQTIGFDVPWLGFYTYAEIGPVGMHNCHHNYSAVVLAIY
jgi:hypothetical protein